MEHRPAHTVGGGARGGAHEQRRGDGEGSAGAADEEGCKGAQADKTSTASRSERAVKRDDRAPGALKLEHACSRQSLASLDPRGLEMCLFAKRCPGHGVNSVFHDVHNSAAWAQNRRRSFERDPGSIFPDRSPCAGPPLQCASLRCVALAACSSVSATALLCSDLRAAGPATALRRAICQTIMREGRAARAATLASAEETRVHATTRVDQHTPLICLNALVWQPIDPAPSHRLTTATWRKNGHTRHTHAPRGRVSQSEASDELILAPARFLPPRSMLLREEEEAASSVASAAPLAARSGSVVVLDKHITFASLHSALPIWLRRDVFPFAIAFAGLLLQAAPALLYEAHVAWIQSGEIELPEATDADATAAPADAAAQVSNGAWELSDSSSELANATAGANATAPLTPVQLEIAALPVPDSLHFWAMYLLPLFGFLYAILWLALYWNVKMQLAMRYRSHRGAGPEAIAQAECIRVQPVEHGGKSEICRLQRGPSTFASGSELFFLFQKTKYIYHEAPADTPAVNEQGEPMAKAWFAPLDFPVGLELSAYLAAGNTGLSTDRAAQLMDKYGENVFDIPLPPFMDLFKEHAMAPFFVFQIFCVLLWCLDEYWVQQHTGPT